jgi:hypothetical protein
VFIINIIVWHLYIYNKNIKKKLLPIPLSSNNKKMALAKAMNLNVNTDAPPSTNSIDNTSYMEALKRLSVISDRQDKYSISLSKYINLEDYLKSKRDVTNYDIIEKPNNKFDVVLYNNKLIVETIKGCVCNGESFQLPRSSVSKRGCSLYNIYLRFSLFK